LKTLKLVAVAQSAQIKPGISKRCPAFQSRSFWFKASSAISTIRRYWLDAHTPDLIAAFASVEGNFTLKDAVWSGQIALHHSQLPFG